LHISLWKLTISPYCWRSVSNWASCRKDLAAFVGVEETLFPRSPQDNCFLHSKPRSESTPFPRLLVLVGRRFCFDFFRLAGVRQTAPPFLSWSDRSLISPLPSISYVSVHCFSPTCVFRRTTRDRVLPMPIFPLRLPPNFRLL